MTRARYIFAVLLAGLMFQGENRAVEPLKGPNCIPVKSLEENKLAYKAGEKLTFSIHYKWGAINSDVGPSQMK